MSDAGLAGRHGLAHLESLELWTSEIERLVRPGVAHPRPGVGPIGHHHAELERTEASTEEAAYHL